MISTPYEIVGLNRSDAIIDVTPGSGLSIEHGTWILGRMENGIGGYLSIAATDGEEVCRLGDGEVILRVNADEGKIPMLVVEEGYEWVPVMTRKLV